MRTKIYLGTILNGRTDVETKLKELISKALGEVATHLILYMKLYNFLKT